MVIKHIGVENNICIFKKYLYIVIIFFIIYVFFYRTDRVVHVLYMHIYVWQKSQKGLLTVSLKHMSICIFIYLD